MRAPGAKPDKVPVTSAKTAVKLTKTDCVAGTKDSASNLISTPHCEFLVIRLLNNTTINTTPSCNKTR